MVKVAALGLITVLLASQFKGGKSEYGLYIGFMGCLLIFFYGMNKLEAILDALSQIQSYIHIKDTYIVLLLKIVGITYIAEFASDLCKDAGYGAVSGQIEFVGKMTILSVSMPVLMALIETIRGFF